MAIGKILQSSVNKKSKFFTLQLSFLSTQGKNIEWENAKPYESIPGPKGSLDIIRMMGPGGKYHNLPLNDIIASFRKDFGTIARFPGFLGQRPMVMTFLPEDIEKVLRTEGKFPNRRPIDSMVYFRKQLRPDLYPAGAGLVVT